MDSNNIIRLAFIDHASINAVGYNPEGYWWVREDYFGHIPDEPSIFLDKNGNILLIPAGSVCEEYFKNPKMFSNIIKVCDIFNYKKREINYQEKSSKDIDNFLIWYIAFGDKKYKDMVAKSINTVLINGNYSGHIVVLTDEDFLIQMPKYDKLKTINIKPDIIKRFPFLNSNHISIKTYQNMRVFINDYVNISEFKGILYMDSDVFINKTEKFLSNIIEFLKIKNKILVQEDRFGCGHGGALWSGAGLLSDHELIIYKNYKICSGLIYIPSNSFGNKFLELWKNNMIKKNLSHDDQGMLYYTIIKYHIPFDYIYDSAMIGKWDETKTFLHGAASGYEFNRILQLYKNWFKI